MNHCCRGKVKRITYSQCVSVALVIQQPKRIFAEQHYDVIRGLSGYTIFFTLLHKRHEFRGKIFLKQNVSFYFLYKFRQENVSFYK